MVYDRLSSNSLLYSQKSPTFNELHKDVYVRAVSEGAVDLHDEGVVELTPQQNLLLFILGDVHL